ncbi:MAG TPA: M23 family metallopeptidase, partial [Enhygromyxa sp.]|nr:M23 family metallopeptidase [Enhygromyxa sp.]
YHAYGQPIHAMDAGHVVMVVDGVPDHEPGVRGAYRLGNTIVVRHAGNLHSVYAHLRPGRARVRSGDAVERGQVLGESGNSGFSTLPHVHVHLQDDFIIGKAWGVEAVFADAVVEREGVQAHMTNVSLLEGDLVAHVAEP